MARKAKIIDCLRAKKVNKVNKEGNIKEVDKVKKVVKVNVDRHKDSGTNKEGIGEEP